MKLSASVVCRLSSYRQGFVSLMSMEVSSPLMAKSFSRQERRDMRSRKLD